MLHNNNKKIVNTLSKNCLRANKIRNLVAILAIVLTTVLFTSVVTILEGTAQSMKEQQIRQSGTEFMMSIKYLTEEESEKFIKHPDFSRIGKLQYLGNIQNDALKKIAVDFSWADESYLEGAFVELKEGKIPVKEDEILIDSVVLNMLGLPEELGQTIPFSYYVNDELREKSLKVAGIYEGNSHAINSTVYISEAFLVKEMEGIEPPADGMFSAGTILLYASFPSEKNLEEKRSKVLSEAGFDPDAQRGEAGFVVSNINNAYGNGSGMDGGMIGGALLLAVVIMLAGYLIISNVFRISILKDMRMYGQLKTLGTTSGQLKKLVRKQANLLNLVGIPIGLCAGYILGFVLLPVIMQATSYGDVQSIHPRLWVFGGSAFFSFLTVWISCGQPAKKMSKMPPIQALRYHGKENGTKKQSGGRESKHRILQMAFSNLTENKGKTFLVVLSLSLSVILFNSIINFTGCFEQKTFVEGQSAADFVVSHISFATRNVSENYVVPSEFLEEADKRTDLEKNGAVYVYQAPDDVAGTSGDHYDGTETVKILTVNGDAYPKEYAKDLGKMLYGFDPGVFERAKVVNGSLDMEKLASGKYIVEAIEFINNNTDYDEENFTLKPGDKVKGEIGGVTLEYEVLANVVVQSGLLHSMSSGEMAFLILPSQEYLAEFPGKLPIHYVMDAKEGQFEKIDSFLKEYEEQPRADIKYVSSSSVVEEFKSLKATYSVAGTVLAVIFGVIGTLNLLNVILTNAVARQREFAIMQSIGMTRKQLKKLFVLEGVSYSLIAGILSLILSGILSVTSVRSLTKAYWFSVYHFNLLPALALFPAYIAAAALIAYTIDRIWNNGSVVERLRISK